MSVIDNTENPKEYLGREKPCIQYVPMAQILKLAEVLRLGAQKYGQKNWRVQPVRMSTYYNAMFRHMVEWFENGEDLDPESKQHHLLHTVACALIILDGMERSSITDDRAFAEVKTGKLAGSTTTDDIDHQKSVSENVLTRAKVLAAVQETLKRAVDPDALSYLENKMRVPAMKPALDPDEEPTSAVTAGG